MKAPPTPGAPGYLLRASLYILATGMRFWTRLLGPRRARKFVIAGLVLSTLTVMVIEARAAESKPTGLVICEVFGDRHCADALDVAWCESRFSVNARNGQYRGLFQMGSYERRNYGHGSTAREQARAAKRYFVATGKDWSPWQCRPDGKLGW